MSFDSVFTPAEYVLDPINLTVAESPTDANFTIIGEDEAWRVQVDFTQSGSLARFLSNLEFHARLMLECLGTAPDQEISLGTINYVPAINPYTYSIDMTIPAGLVPASESVYETTLVITQVWDGHDHGPSAAFVEGPKLQFYKRV